MNIPMPIDCVPLPESSGCMDFCDIAIFDAGTISIVIRYTYFEGYLVILSKAQISNAQIYDLSGIVYDQRKRFHSGIGKGRNLCIKIFPLLLCSSPDCFKFVLYHEIAHIRNGDIKIADYRALRKDSISRGNVLIPELRADMYAAKKLGKERALKALEEILKRKSRSLTHLHKFGLHHMDKLLTFPVLLENYKIEDVNLQSSISELEGRLKVMQELNIK